MNDKKVRQNLRKNANRNKINKLKKEKKSLIERSEGKKKKL